MRKITAASGAMIAVFGLLCSSAAMAAAVPVTGNKDFANQMGARLSYPEQALEDNVQGIVVVSVQMNQHDAVTGVHLDRSSGNPSLDREVMRVAKDTSPSFATSNHGTVTAKIDFRL